MKILFISNEPSRTGAPLALLALMKSLSNNREIQFDVLLIRKGDLHKDYVKLAHKVFIHDTTNRNRFLSRIIGKIKRFLNLENYILNILKHKKYDLIYANTIETLSIGCALKQKIKKPLISHIHESEYLLSLYNADSHLLNLCDKIISVSSLSKYALETSYSVSLSKIEVIHPFSPYINYTDIPVDCNETSQNHELIIGLSGYLDWVKGYDLLPLVIKQFAIKHPNIDAQFIWVGSNRENYGKRLRIDLQKLGLQKYLYLAGTTDNPIQYYQSFDIFLLLSREDSFPLVALENAYLGKPIISMEGATGINDLLRQDAGIIVPYLSIDGIVDAIHRLYTDKFLAKRIGKNAQTLVLTQFNKDKSINRIVKEIMKYSSSN